MFHGPSNRGAMVTTCQETKENPHIWYLQWSQIHPFLMFLCRNVGSTIVNPPPIFFFNGGVASHLLIFGPNSPRKSKRQIKTIQPQLNE